MAHRALFHLGGPNKFIRPSNDAATPHPTPGAEADRNNGAANALRRTDILLSLQIHIRMYVYLSIRILRCLSLHPKYPLRCLPLHSSYRPRHPPPGAEADRNDGATHALRRGDALLSIFPLRCLSLHPPYRSPTETHYRGTSLIRNSLFHQDHHRTLGIVLLKGPMRGVSLMSEVSLYTRCRGWQKQRWCARTTRRRCLSVYTHHDSCLYIYPLRCLFLHLSIRQRCNPTGAEADRNNGATHALRNYLPIHPSIHLTMDLSTRASMNNTFNLVGAEADRNNGGAYALRISLPIHPSIHLTMDPSTHASINNTFNPVSSRWCRG